MRDKKMKIDFGDDVAKLQEHLLENYQVRNSCLQKLCFRKWMERYVENSKYVYNLHKYPLGRNIIIGDLESSKVILTAHYDTPFKTKVNRDSCKSFFDRILLCFLGIVLVCVFMSLKDDFNWVCLLIFAVIMVLFVLLLSNKKNANDNTSGVLTLLSILNIIDLDESEKVCFVFFDQEELLKRGSREFKKKYGKVIEDKLLINFDCVGDGDTVYFITGECSKHSTKFKQEYFSKEKSILKKSLDKVITERKKKDSDGGLTGFRFRSSFKCESVCADNGIDDCKCNKTYKFTSDHNNFVENGIGVKVASENNFFHGKERYHTCKDTVLDVENIEMLSNVMADFICYLSRDEEG